MEPMQADKQKTEKTKAVKRDMQKMRTAGDDVDMAGSEDKPRKIVKAKRRLDDAESEDKPKLLDENGDEISFEDDEDEWEEEVNYIDEQEVVQVDADEWIDDDNSGAIEVKDAVITPEEKKAGEVKKEKKKKNKAKGAKDQDMDASDTQSTTKVWNEAAEPLKEDEELDFDSSAYAMLHRANVEWPCLSLDVLVRERCQPERHDYKSWFPSQVANSLTDQNSAKDERLGVKLHQGDKYPMSVYFAAGSQNSLSKSENKIYVMKWSEMEKTVNDDEVPREDSDEDEDDLIAKMNAKLREPVIRVEAIPHRGCVNRLRTLHGSSVVATWSDDGEVGIYDVQAALEELDTAADANVLAATSSVGKKKKKKAAPKKNYGGSKLAGFRHKQEGYALEWSPLNFGRLASGSCDAHLNLYAPADENCSSFVKETQVALQGHKDSIEDIQWSPMQADVLATCSVDKTIKLWDLRATQMKCQMSWQAHDCDVNVMSWNTDTKFLLASGDDRGEFKIWDMRMLGEAKGSSSNKQLEAITKIRWHTAAITSIQFEPREASVLAVASADNKLTIWDFSVEADEQETAAAKEHSEQAGFDIPPQLLFLHQGQKNMKELRFHPQYHSLLLTTAEDSFNIFRPNLDPDFVATEQPIPEEYNEEEDSDQESEAKQSDSTKMSSSMPAEEDRRGREPVQRVDYELESDEDMDAENDRIARSTKQMTKNRANRSKSKTKKRS